MATAACDQIRMLADGIVAAGPVGDFITLGVPIIPEVTLLGKELIFVIEIDLIEPAVQPIAPPPLSLFTLDTRAITITGADLFIPTANVLTLDTRAIIVTGGDLVITAANVLTLDTRAVTVTGGDLIVLAANVLTLDTASVNIAGANIIATNAGLGATPAFASVGATTTSLTLAGTHAIAYPAGVQLGDLLLLPAVGRTNNNDAILALHANMVAANWAHVTGSPFESTTQRTLLLAWKLAEAVDVSGSAASGNISGGIVATGGASNDEFLGRCQRWTAANGWATPTPFESIINVLESNNTAISALTITPTDQNRRAISIFGGNAAVTSFAFAGETGGDWTVATHVAGTLSTINTQTADLSAGTAISGGTATMSAAAGGPLVALALAPSGSSGGGGGPFVVAGFYPEYRSGSHVTHAQIPWDKMDQVYYFSVYPRCHYQASLLTSTDVFTSLGHPFTNGQTVQLRNVSGAATPSHAGGSLAYDTNFFVRDVVAGTSFKLALTSGGTAIDFTGTGGSDGRCFKAPGSYAHRYEFDPPIDVANANDLIAQRDAQNPNCKVFLTLGGANSMADFRDALDWNGSTVSVGSRAGVAALVDSMLDIIELHGFDGVDVDAELISASGAGGLGGDGQYVWDLAVELRAQMDTRFGTTPRMPLVIGAFSRSGPSNTKEELAAALVNNVPPLSDWILLPAYGFTFPNQSGQMVLPHNALNAAMDSGITPAIGNDMIETLEQFTDVGVPASKIIYGLQAGGVPWIGGVMTSGAAGNSPSSVGRGARFPGDSWSAGGGVAPGTTWPDGELLFRDRSDVTGTSAYIVDAAGDFAYVAFTGASAAFDVFCAFDSPETAVAKRAYWEAQGIGGLFLWELAGDDPTFPILEAMGPPAGP